MNDWWKRKKKIENRKFPKTSSRLSDCWFPRERASASSRNCESRRDAHLLIPAYLCWCGCYQGRACRQESKRRTGSGQRDCLLAELGSFPISFHCSPTPFTSVSLAPRGSSLKGSGSEPIRSRRVSITRIVDRFSGKQWRRFSRLPLKFFSSSLGWRDNSELRTWNTRFVIQGFINSKDLINPPRVWKYIRNLNRKSYSC